MNWAERHIQQIETPKTKAKEYIEWGLKLLFTATGITVVFFALMFLIVESVETKNSRDRAVVQRIHARVIDQGMYG